MVIIDENYEIFFCRFQYRSQVFFCILLTLYDDFEYDFILKLIIFKRLVLRENRLTSIRRLNSKKSLSWTKTFWSIKIVNLDRI